MEGNRDVDTAASAAVFELSSGRLPWTFKTFQFLGLMRPGSIVLDANRTSLASKPG